MILDQQIAVLGRILGKAGDNLSHGFQNAGEGRMAAYLRVGIQLQRHEIEGNTLMQKGPQHLERISSATMPHEIAGNDTGQFPDGAVRAMGLVAREEGPAEQQPGKVGHDLPDTVGHGIAGRGQRIGQGVGIELRLLLNACRRFGQGRCSVDAPFLKGDKTGAQIALLIHPDADAPLLCQQNGFPVQRPPVAHQHDICCPVFFHAAADPERPFVDVSPPEADIAGGRPEDPVAAAGNNLADPAAVLFQRFSQLVEEGAVRPLQKKKTAYT